MQHPPRMGPETAAWVESVGSPRHVRVRIGSRVKKSLAQSQQWTKPKSPAPIPEPAVAAILAAFDRYEIVGMPEAHRLKEAEDFIVSLIRSWIWVYLMNLHKSRKKLFWFTQILLPLMAIVFVGPLISR